MKKSSYVLILAIAFLLVSCSGSDSQPTVQALLEETTVPAAAEGELETGGEAAVSPANTRVAAGEDQEAAGSAETGPAMATEPATVSVEAADGLSIAGTFYPGAGSPPWPGVMLLHMNGRMRGDWDAVARRLADSGYAALAVDMRGHGQTGGKADWEQTADDLRRVWTYLAGRDDVDESWTGVVGASIGANMSLVTAAAQPAIKTAVLLSAGLDYFGVTTNDAIVDYGPRPILLVASEDDSQAARSTRRLEELAQGEAQLQIYQDAGHGTTMLGRQPELVDLIVQWLDRHLKGENPEGAANEASNETSNENSFEVSLAPTLFDVGWDDRAVFREGLIDAEAPILDQTPDASVYHLNLVVAPDLRSVSGEQEVRYINQEDVALDAVHFHLYPAVLGGRIEISELAMDGLPVEPEFVNNRSVLRVALAQPLPPGEPVVIRVAYQVDIPTEGGTNYGVFATIDGVMALAHFYPQISVYDDEGWNIAYPSENADVTYADIAYYLVRVDAPAEAVLVASGIEIDRLAGGGRQTVTFAAGPVRDFYIAASEDYIVASQKFGQTTINSYGFPQFKERIDQTLGVAVAAMESFQERLGAYPYTEFDIAPTPNLALGVEYPGVVVIRAPLYDPEAFLGRTPASFYLEGTVAHEVGHQWFYGVVGNDQPDEPWVDESLVQYLTYLYFVDTYGADAGDSYKASFDRRWEAAGRESIPIGMPAGSYEGSEYSAIVYGRGPLFFDTLAQELGDEAFSSFLRDYYQSHKFSIATGERVKATAEEHCGCDLTPLFAEWVGET